MSLHCIAAEPEAPAKEVYFNLYLEQHIAKGLCQPIVSYFTDSPIGTGLGLRNILPRYVTSAGTCE